MEFSLSIKLKFYYAHIQNSLFYIARLTIIILYNNFSYIIYQNNRDVEAYQLYSEFFISFLLNVIEDGNTYLPIGKILWTKVNGWCCGLIV